MGLDVQHKVYIVQISQVDSVLLQQIYSNVTLKLHLKHVKHILEVMDFAYGVKTHVFH